MNDNNAVRKTPPIAPKNAILPFFVNPPTRNTIAAVSAGVIASVMRIGLSPASSRGMRIFQITAIAKKNEMSARIPVHPANSTRSTQNASRSINSASRR
jgi:hypothetical protein